ncbi:hypothetical protein AOLI_G00044520 [Acnodon oligacanthus]
MVDFGVGLMLASARKILQGRNFSKYHEYKTLLGNDVRGATLGIIGMGRIGYKVIKRTQSFDMKILYDSRNQRDHPLLSFPNMIVLPHMGTHTVEATRVKMETRVTNALAALNGEQSPNELKVTRESSSVALEDEVTELIMAKPCILAAIGEKGIYRCFAPCIEKHFTIISYEMFAQKRKHFADKIQAVFVWGGSIKFDSSMLQSLPKLKVLVNGGVGVDHLDIPLINSFGVKVCNTPHVVDNATADIGMSLMLASARKIVQGHNFSKYHESEFLPESSLGNDVSCATLGIIGMGRIGYKVAKRAQSFDMKILYHNRNRRTEEEEKAVGAVYCEKMEELLRKSDFVMLVVNLSPQTQKLIGAKELAMMKPSSTLINISRGLVVDQDALVDALQRKIIKAAALDVTYPEPLPSAVERGDLLLGQQLVLHSTLPRLAPWKGHSSFASQRRNNMGSSSLPLISYNVQMASSVTPGVASDDGRDLCISLDSNHPPQVGQSPASKVLSRHGLPSSLDDKGSERLLTFRLHTSEGPVTLISAYAPTLTSTPEAKDEFYTNLNDVIKNIHSSEHLVLLGDLNARVDEATTQSVMVIVRRTSLKPMILTRSYHSADCDSDHLLVCCKIKLVLNCSKQEGKPRIDTTKMQHPGKIEEFTKFLKDALTAGYPCSTTSESWNYLREAIQKSALAAFGRKTSKNCDWFNAKSARRKVQQTEGRCANEDWQELSQEIQNAAATGKIRGMYVGIKKALRPTKSRTTPLKTSSRKVITDKAKQMERWCWREGGVLQDMRDAKIITLYKNKGHRSNCNNYRGISLLSILGKLYARVLLVRLQQLAERIYPESQCGFQADRSTVDMIFSLRQLQKKCREQQKPLYVAFIDLNNAFDLVSQDGLFNILLKIRCPRKLHSMIRSFHDATLGQLTTRVWENPKLTTLTKMDVYNACVVSTLLYGSESWTTYAKQDQKLNSFYMLCIRRILGISWNDKVPNAQIPKDIFYETTPYCHFQT